MISRRIFLSFYLVTSVLIFSLNSFSQNLVNGKEAHEYYKNFIYQVRQVEGAPTPMYLVLAPIEEKLPISNGSYASLTFFLINDGSFILRYDEFAPTKSGSYAESFGKNTSGRWVIKGSQLLLGDLGTGEGKQVSVRDVGDKPVLVDGISLNFSKKVGQLNLKGKSLILIRMLTSEGVDD